MVSALPILVLQDNIIIVLTPYYHISEKSENFDAFLDKLGVGFMVKTAAKTLKPTLEVEVAGDTYTLRSLSTFKNTEIKFKLGEEFEEDRADGKKVQTSVVKEGDSKLVQVQKGDKEVTIVREFSDEGLTVTATVNGVTSVRFYKRL